jgi:hypothetical protein
VTLSSEQRAELESLAPATVRIMLIQGGPGRGASIPGFKCGEITKGDIDDWLVEKNAERESRERELFDVTQRTYGYTRKTYYAALAALLAAVAGIIVTVLHL